MQILETLRVSLYTWHFEFYGTTGAIACYPPNPPDAYYFGQLNAMAPITSVCGPFYVVTRLRHVTLTPANCL